MTSAAAPCGKINIGGALSQIQKGVQKQSMNMKTRKFTGRITLIALAILMLLTLLTACGGKAQKKLTVGSVLLQTKEVEVQKTDEDGNPVLDENGDPVKETEQKILNSLNQQQLQEIAEMLASVCSNEFDPQTYLVAAQRGYDMLATDFNDKTASNTENGSADPLKTAIKVINEANNKASEANKIAFGFDKLNDSDLKTLINAFQTKVNVEADSGIFDVILTAIGKVLSWMTATLGFGNYLVGICLFAILIEILMLPFAVKQQKNSIKQASLRPKEMAIRNKYKGRNDQVTMQKMQQELQEFYQRENFSPYSGCLPLVIQLPIIIALYNIVINPLHYVMGQASGITGALNTYFTTARAAGGLGETLGNSTIEILSHIKDNAANNIDVLEGLKNFAFFSNGDAVYSSLGGVANAIPNFNIGPFNFGLIPSFEHFDILLLVPVLTFAAYFLTSKLNRKLMYQPATNGGADERQVACSNSMMDVTMPLMSTFFTFMVPALVGVYWIFRSLIGVLKQFIMTRIMPLPTFTEEDYKQAAKEMAGKKSKTVKKSENAGKVRSLHYIDDEDFEDTRERGLARRAAIEEREREEQAKKAKNTPFGAAPMKDERRKDKTKNEEESRENADSTENNDNQNDTQE